MRSYDGRHIASDREAFPPGRGRQPVVEGDDFERRGPPFRRDKVRRELQGVGGTQRVHADKTDGCLTDRLNGFDLVPGARELEEPIERVASARLVEGPVAFETCNCRRAFRFTSPPDQHHRIGKGELLQAGVARSFSSSGTIAEESQNFIARLAARQGALPRRRP